MQSSSRAAATQPASSSPSISLPVGLQGFEHQDGAETAPEDLAPQLGDREAVALLGVEQDRDGREAPKDVEQLFVGGVVGQEVAEVDRSRPPHRRA